ncbi:hypothetical protein B0H66DRAFT_560904 [Apodospora peruviana]|uniref:Secreted protein n=1 Tax=Apodospora peruviana TaxID=516989 RepID=A0AAE0M1Y2_9PEZI|nr:hypothetical protein B0H66DRAFT_560904 [Apodospora peruviana]
MLPGRCRRPRRRALRIVMVASCFSFVHEAQLEVAVARWSVWARPAQNNNNNTRHPRHVLWVLLSKSDRKKRQQELSRSRCNNWRTPRCCIFPSISEPTPPRNKVSAKPGPLPLQSSTPRE